ncbi:hypothetical protein CPB83DRAFT_624435 [Crepidotus variabilis]|uniref:Ankyrin n=1 Tax=Crepidotus variabilis TaxID=179855 RepID=A0A9P6ENS6_9AGAR|nr:hypothetical protein CPB83DRAFT_624435 [Crepidotus variabilis]
MSGSAPHSLNYGLHDYALQGDDERVQRALREGADVNGVDSAGRTAVMCAIAGENWRDIDACDASFMSSSRLNALKTLLNHPEISLLTLNAPHSSMNGVIPLGVAAWLNQPLVVRTLLECSAEAVSVDGMDAHGATALMYGARDGSLEVVQLLLSHGARPDFRDRNHRTSLQFALSHPRILWLCESVLRRHRWRESKTADRTRLASDSDHIVDLAFTSMPLTEDLEPPPALIFTQDATLRLTNALSSSIRSSDLAFLQSLLFSPHIPASSPSALYPMSVPLLVNAPDAKGWSPIHHCVAARSPSIEILDALYCAGADISLFTTQEQETPLHILARSIYDPSFTHPLRRFILHLIQDLRAPLSARDKNDETPLHIAAEHGHSVEILLALLDCDINCNSRSLKNARGLTAEDICKSEFLATFQQHQPSSRSPIRATESFASLASISETRILDLSGKSSSLYSKHMDIESAIQSLLSSLRATCPSINHSANAAHIHQLEDCVEEANDQCNAIVIHFRGRIEEASRMVQELQGNTDRISSLRNAIQLAARGKLLVRELTPLPSRRRNRDSEDSQATYVCHDDYSDIASSIQASASFTPRGYISQATQTALLDQFGAKSAYPCSPAKTDPSDHSKSSKAEQTYFEELCEVDRELSLLQEMLSSESTASAASPKLIAKTKAALKRKKRLEEKIRELDVEQNKIDKQASLSGTSRVKAWIKKMVVPAQVPSTTQLRLVVDLDPDCNVGREVKRSKPVSTKSTYRDAIDASIDTALRTSSVVLESAYYDLNNINESLSAAQQFIDLANHSISRTQRIVKRAIKKRRDMIADLHVLSSKESKLAVTVEGLLSPGYLGYHSAVTNRSSLTSISTIYSTTSSIISIAATLTEHDDEDTRVIRRLLLRKIEAQISGVWDELDQVNEWTQIVKESVRGVKRRAYL